MRTLFNAVIICFSIILISAVPVLFQEGIHLDFGLYFSTVFSILSNVIAPWDMTYHPSLYSPEYVYPLFPTYFKFYSYSLLIFFSAFFLAFGISSILTYITMQLNKKSIDRLKFLASLLEAVPDIFIIVSFQLLIWWIHHETGVKLMPTISYEPIYVMPIICLSILPAVLFYKIMLFIIEDELAEKYVEFAKGKGMTRHFILLVHVVRNSLIHLFNHTKYIFWFMLSNFVMVEIIFNMQGIIWFVMKYTSPEIIAYTFLLFFLPVHGFLSLVKFIIQKSTGQKGAI